MPITSAPILDVRPACDFERGHHPNAVNIPLESLVRRMHELPRPSEPLRIFDPCRTRSRWAASRLRAHGRTNLTAEFGVELLDGIDLATGPCRGRLWSAHALLTEIALPEMLRAWGSLAGRSALDLACGSGRDAIAMAEAGLTVAAWDRFDEALDRCRDLATRCGVAVETRQVDIETDACLQPNTFDVIACFNFLYRPLMPAIADAIRPGGFVVYETFTIEQRRRFGKPRRDKHVLLADELPTYFEEWEHVYCAERLAAPRRFVASLVARNPEART